MTERIYRVHLNRLGFELTEREKLLSLLVKLSQLVLYVPTRTLTNGGLGKERNELGTKCHS